MLETVSETLNTETHPLLLVAALVFNSASLDCLLMPFINPGPPTVYAGPVWHSIIFPFDSSSSVTFQTGDCLEGILPWNTSAYILLFVQITPTHTRGIKGTENKGFPLKHALNGSIIR